MSQTKQIARLPLYKYPIHQLEPMRAGVVELINELTKQRVNHRKQYPRNDKGTLLGKARVHRETLNKALKSSVIDRDELDTEIWCKTNRVHEGLGMTIISKKLGKVYATLKRVQVTVGVVLLSFEVKIYVETHTLTTYLLTKDTFNPKKLP